MRIDKSNALIKTFIYKPLLGMTSSTNPNGFTQTYNYDSYGRLSTIVDMNGNVQKSFNYKQTEFNPQLLHSIKYSNVPAFGSSWYSCGSNSGVTLVHQYFPGGYFVPDIDKDLVQKNAQFTAENWSPSPYYDMDCVSESQVSSIKLTNYAIASIPFPQDAHLELFQDGSIVGSRTFPTTYAGVNQFYFKPGTYKASIRQSVISGGVIIKYLVSNSVGEGFLLRSGEMITLQPGVTYTIQINNTL